jgi:hypothetical protein
MLSTFALLDDVYVYFGKRVYVICVKMKKAKTRTNTISGADPGFQVRRGRT